ncbi:MAG: GNAT family N-acetyltransferase [Solirubrobacteraceae bacterium]|nr:GNAT family N-acetyltransferase [Solirubrobacteraceae bacterium]
MRFTDRSRRLAGRAFGRAPRDDEPESAGSRGVRFPVTGRRLELRPFSLDDVPAIHRVYSDPEVMRWVGHGAVGSQAATESILRQYMAHQRLHGFAFWAVTDRETGEVVGDAGLARTVDGEIEMGYTLARDRWGVGLGTETAALCLKAGRSIGVERLRALVEEPNVASRHVLEKLGFEQDGVTLAFGRPHLVYRLTL